MAGQSTNDIPAALAVRLAQRSFAGSWKLTTYCLQAINFELSRFTIDKLKAVLRQLNDNCGQYLKMTGKKMELVSDRCSAVSLMATHRCRLFVQFQRCQDTIAALSRSADTSKFWTARRIVSGQ